MAKEEIEPKHRKREAVWGFELLHDDPICEPYGFAYNAKILKVGEFSFLCSWLRKIDDARLQMMPHCCRIALDKDDNPFIFCVSDGKCSHVNSNKKMFKVNLKKLMGEEVWSRFNSGYAGFARGRFIQRGLGESFLSQVEPIVEWYVKFKTQMDHLVRIADMAKVSSDLLSLWSEFMEMWIDGHPDQQDKVMKHITNCYKIPSDLYSFWCSCK
jgi:hypothetical protein